MQTSEILELVNRDIQQNPYTGVPAELYEPINYMLALGGKRIRPVLLLMGSDLFHGSLQKALPAARAIEIFHNFTLVHDDIMDKAPLRRGQPTVHIKWNNNTAILAGDLMMIKAVELLNTLDAPVLSHCLQLFLRTAAEVCEGQQLDMNFETQNSVSIEEYLHMIELKTAVLLGCALQMGAIIGAAPTDDARHLYEFGRNIGLAFQLQDDILDVFGKQAAVGKQVGGDIVANKKTFLLIKAFEMATPGQKQLLQKWISVPEFNEQEKVAAITDIYEQLGVRALAEQSMHTYLEKAFKHLDAVRADESKKQQLAELANSLQQRAH